MELQAFFQRHPKVALAFSGGTDSSYLLYAATACGAAVRPYFVRSQFQPAFELQDAERLAGMLNVPLTVIELDVLACGTVAENPPNRCYFCKQRIFSALTARARADGYDTLIDGTNASDDSGDRPGMRALEEMGIQSPLRLCGITKDDVRARSRAAGLFTWDKPSYACLATRIAAGEPITAEKLHAVEASEGFLYKLGFSDLRVRVDHGTARVQVPRAQLPAALAQRDKIVEQLRQYYDTVTIDPKGR